DQAVVGAARDTDDRRPAFATHDTATPPRTGRRSAPSLLGLLLLDRQRHREPEGGFNPPSGALGIGDPPLGHDRIAFHRTAWHRLEVRATLSHQGCAIRV